MKEKTNDYVANLGKDIPAGLVVFLVALPLCLGIALASGAPLFSGLITGIVGGLVVAWLSGSQLSVSGPAAGLTVIVLNGIETLGAFEGFLLAVVLAGALQLVLGFVKAGVIGLYFPSSVIRGMLAAIGLILILKQIPHFLGADEDFFGEMEFFQPDGRNTFSEIGYAFSSIQPGSLIIGIVSLVILVLWDNDRLKRYTFFKLVPGALVVVLLAVVLNLLFSSAFTSLAIAESHLVSIPIIGSSEELAGVLQLPDFSFLTNPDLYIVAFTIAIVASLETLLSVEAVDKLDPHKRRTDTNRELKAQGVGNMVAGMLGGLPMTAVIVRSSANVASGGQTRVSAFVHGVFLALSVFFLAEFLNMVPLSALAAVLLMVGFKLTKPSLYKGQLKLGHEQFVPFIVTILAILFTDLLIGICIGLAVGVFYILKANYKSPYFFHREESANRDTIHIKLSEHVSFLNKASIILTLDQLPHNSHVIIDGANSAYIDYDVLEAIMEFKKTAHERNIHVEVLNVNEVSVMDMH
ncbi:MFS superfamily sulfate permease-like transporter [Pontibacter ummariensis]|uniref:Sulfate permease, MFS superfamily n=1 Tax=Pontibacter ummariensis TaxID=1610492 RepID=A0A239JTA4_9BACT|nr:SulP family inorganic anion transporter [Pontibacter ummariensis]PRY07406.1 MFS superfamily sulfate permease-like transporter [Pontibacter ummariensis]SNT08668.1 Sulfate permease, MFS superfamily [Pontibacter ummariensis]